MCTGCGKKVARLGTRCKSSRLRRDRDIGFTSRDETLKFRDETFVALET